MMAYPIGNMNLCLFLFMVSSSEQNPEVLSLILT